MPDSAATDIRSSEKPGEVNPHPPPKPTKTPKAYHPKKACGNDGKAPSRSKITKNSFLESTSIFQREYEPLLKTKDAYPKMILARTKQEEYDDEGIRIADSARWLGETA